MSTLKERARVLHARIPHARRLVAEAMPELYEELGPVLVGLALHHGFDSGHVSAAWLATRAREKYELDEDAHLCGVRGDEAR